VKLLYVPEKLPNLVRLGLASAALQVERTRCGAVFVNVMAATDPIQAIAESLHNLAELRKLDILRVGQQLFVNLARTHEL
jgi:hypothetical protein